MQDRVFAAMMFHNLSLFFSAYFDIDNWYKRWFFYHTYYWKISKDELKFWKLALLHISTYKVTALCVSQVWTLTYSSILQFELKAQVNFSYHFLSNFHMWVCPSVRPSVPLSVCNLFKFSTLFSRTTGSAPIKLGIRIPEQTGFKFVKVMDQIFFRGEILRYYWNLLVFFWIFFSNTIWPEMMELVLKLPKVLKIKVCSNYDPQW